MICRTQAVALAAVSVGLFGCGDTPSEPNSGPNLPALSVHGSYVAVRAAGAPLEQVCFTHPDPSGSGLLSLGLLTFASVRATVRRQEVRLTGPSGCSMGDTVRVDVERVFRVAGPYALIHRLRDGNTVVEDTATIIGRTLVVRSGPYDYVYELVTLTDAVFFTQTGDIAGWMVGQGSFGTSADEWSMALQPTHGIRNQRMYFFRAGGRPAVGVYRLGRRATAPFSALVVRDTPGGGFTYESSSGEITITDSSPERVAGSFRFLGFDGANRTTPVTGNFIARCRAACQ